MARGKFFSNQQIADLLRKVAAAYLVKGENRFRVAAYEEAAAAIEHSTSELKDLWDAGKLEEVPGVGKSIAGHLAELFQTGKVNHFAEVFRRLPPAMFIFEKIPGVGPKRAYALAKGLGIKEEKGAVNRLKSAISENKVAGLEGFGEKLQADLLKGIASLEKGEVTSRRMPLYLADQIAEDVLNYLLANPLVIEAHPLGSLRRRLATVGDIDVSVATNEPKKVLDYFFKYPVINKIVSRGEEALGRVLLRTGQQVDLRVALPQSYGAMLQYFTGSKQHNINLRQFALGKGLSLSEYGIKNIKNQTVPVGRQVAEFENEKKFYEFLGLQYIPPEIREGTEEIELARKGNLPQLVEFSQIKGDLHLHSDFPIESSHDLGVSSVDEMVKLAEDLFYEYLGFSEHNPAASRHSQDRIIDILKAKMDFFEHKKYSYEKSAQERAVKLPIKILNGLEIDIKTNGELAVPDKGLDLLDYAIVSIHTGFEMTKEKMTDRIITGLSHPKAKILGHPTGRKIGEREGYEVDWDRLFAFCLKNDKILEICAWPNRMDLPDFLVRAAVKYGVKMLINTDAHAVSQMKLMPYGVSVARRGWAEAQNISNTLAFEKLNAILC